MVSRNPLTREILLKAAIALADDEGIASLSMRKLGQRLGVEAMSLYNHVGNKDELLTGIADTLIGEFEIPSEQLEWQAAMRFVAESVRNTLLRHPWAVSLIESQVAPSKVRFERADALIGALRRAGFSIELAYKAHLAINSYIVGFIQQEIHWPFKPMEQGSVAAMLQPQVNNDEFPYLSEMLGSIIKIRQQAQNGSEPDTYAPDFNFGLDLLLNSLEKIRLESQPTKKKSTLKSSSVKR
ncbi:MAG: TetR/AcrR family transcriptional regulator C-terminal domain-containing protein [Gammaproteobacteria bacterium]|nr:TetR/AcrR family transcriptional regulator C-terminal domain-containing protein [Gammaproteobacteria bacterium]MDH3449321.1 TetR/AcrR family transcriptional regulator C-terminal domain-containing protein [Gammaproteobacteria bacterium]